MNFFLYVEKQLPVKQGLWQFNILCHHLLYSRWKTTSSKTRIMTISDEHLFLLSHDVEKQLPVKQGLWLMSSPFLFLKWLAVEKQLPVKQGLWPLLTPPDSIPDSLCWKTTSSKTRIMTEKEFDMKVEEFGWKTTSSKTRIMTLMLFLLYRVRIFSVEKQLPVKQGLWR